MNIDLRTRPGLTRSAARDNPAPGVPAGVTVVLPRGPNSGNSRRGIVASGGSREVPGPGPEINVHRVILFSAATIPAEGRSSIAPGGGRRSEGMVRRWPRARKPKRHKRSNHRTAAAKPGHVLGQALALGTAAAVNAVPCATFSTRGHAPRAISPECCLPGSPRTEVYSCPRAWPHFSRHGLAGRCVACHTRTSPRAPSWPVPSADRSRSKKNARYLSRRLRGVRPSSGRVPLVQLENASFRAGIVSQLQKSRLQGHGDAGARPPVRSCPDRTRQHA